MTYRHTLIARSLRSEVQPDEPAVLDYLQLRNRQCLDDWRAKRAQYAQRLASDESQARKSQPNFA